MSDNTVPHQPMEPRSELMLTFEEMYIIADEAEHFDADNLPARIKIYNVLTNKRPGTYSVDLAKTESFYQCEMYYFAVTQLEHDLRHKKIELYYDSWRYRIKPTEKHPTYNFFATVLHHYAKNAEKNPVGDEATNPAQRWKCARED